MGASRTEFASIKAIQTAEDFISLKHHDFLYSIAIICSVHCSDLVYDRCGRSAELNVLCYVVSQSPVNREGRCEESGGQ
jgi:hypothetical protein